MKSTSAFKYRVGDLVVFNGGIWHVCEYSQSGELLNSLSDDTPYSVLPLPAKYVLLSLKHPAKVEVEESWIESLHRSWMA